MTTSPTKSQLEKFLSLFTEVRTDEGPPAILLFFNIFLILTSYYIMKPVREALILTGGGAEIKSYAAAGQAILLLGAIPIYSWLASRFPRKRLINVVTFTFASCLGLFFLLALAEVPLGVVFFLWVGIFNLMVPAQFWAFSNDIYTVEAGKRIFVIIAFGQSMGAVFGPFITGQLSAYLGVYQLLLVAGAILLASLIFTNIVDSREKTKQKDLSTTQVEEIDEPLPKGGAFRLVFKTKYLLLIALLMLFLNWVNTTGEYILGRTVQDTANEIASTPEVNKQAQEYALDKLNSEDIKKMESSDESTRQSIKEHRVKQYRDDYIKQYEENYILKFYADFYFIVNLAAVLIQLFVVSRVLKYLGVRIALLVLPLIALGGYFIMAFFPILTIVRWAKTAENSTDYSLQNTVRQVLFLPTTREQKYKAKQAIDTFFWRAGDVLSALLVYVGTTFLAFQTKQFALFNIALVFIWLAIAFFIGIENKKLSSKYQEQA